MIANMEESPWSTSTPVTAWRCVPPQRSWPCSIAASRATATRRAEAGAPEGGTSPPLPVVTLAQSVRWHNVPIGRTPSPVRHGRDPARRTPSRRHERPPSLVGPRRHVLHGAAHLPRPDRAQRRPAHAGQGAPSELQPAAVDHRRLHAHQRRPAALWWGTGRSLRPAEDLPGRCGHLRKRFAGLRAGARRECPDRRTSTHRRGRRIPHARHAVDRHLHVPGGRARPCHRDLGRRGRDRDGGGTAARRVAAAALLVGFGVPHQRPRGRDRLRGGADPRRGRTPAGCCSASTRSAWGSRRSGWSR